MRPNHRAYRRNKVLRVSKFGILALYFCLPIKKSVDFVGTLCKRNTEI